MYNYKNTPDYKIESTYAKSDFQKWLQKLPDNAIVEFQKQFREDPKKKFKVVVTFE
tara:strand:- start:244 stop:411 length:168 start_codon:yes stop_codon:yes gene_type:complete